MTDKELKKLKRSELLEILLFLQKEYDELKAENEVLAKKVALLEEKSLEASDSLSDNDLEKVSVIINSSLNTGKVNTDEIAGTLEAVIERWQKSEKVDKLLSEEKIANRLEGLINEHYCRQADVRATVLQKGDYKNLAEVFDYLLRCNDKKHRREGTLHEKDAELILRLLAQHEKSKKSERNLTDEDMSFITDAVGKAVKEALGKA